MTYQITPKDALIVVDIQNDFCQGGALAVPGGDEIIFAVNGLMELFTTRGAKVVLTQDWHPSNQVSFASRHGREPFTTIELPYGTQTLWPNHCVQGSRGAEFHHWLNASKASAIIRKGMNPEIDSYSAFQENDQRTFTGLDGYLHALGVTRVFVVGLAYDYCVGYTALDAKALCAFETIVIKDLCRAIAEDSAAAMETEFHAHDVAVVEAANII